jgi:hypothetical protein
MSLSLPKPIVEYFAAEQAGDARRRRHVHRNRRD